ncbi:hypothetical protein CORC01_06292 [Colletotrichum orchidophilum]|uniref:WD-like domain-containing protein n=1 Tax=Colletotrichum orchidophilum TaxID=1209926 RepID=A0A1G4BAR6_9PEZI|nr:uncharacterized protein CORC01_06292 [Colletotrichum orchidophilum]OHE98501.1 hypothetical protein CORC01_06292 [Colletotrichum orchidophilum]
MILPEVNTSLTADLHVARALPYHLIPHMEAVAVMESKFPSHIVLDYWTTDVGNFSTWAPKDYTDISIAPTLPQAEVDAATAAGTTAELCGENELVCAKSHQALSRICMRLIENLKEDRSDDMVRGTPQDYCLEMETEHCCVSWNAMVDKTTRIAELVPAAEIVYDNCRDMMRTYVSGKVYGAIVGNKCLNQCLSNRPGGC